MQIRLFSKLLLREIRLLAVLTHFFTKFAAMMGFPRHSAITTPRSALALHTV
jgi:hypothetical protein